jgi:polyphosphate kinase 2 (PPK2 family)
VFCTEDEVARFLSAVPLVERTMVESAIILLKYWLEVSPDEQTRRLEHRDVTLLKRQKRPTGDEQLLAPQIREIPTPLG